MFLRLLHVLTVLSLVLSLAPTTVGRPLVAQASVSVPKTVVAPAQGVPTADAQLAQLTAAEPTFAVPGNTVDLGRAPLLLTPDLVSPSGEGVQPSDSLTTDSGVTTWFGTEQSGYAE